MRSLEQALTGSPNRRALDDEQASKCAWTNRHERPLQLALWVVDNFTRINDTTSHTVDDAVLVAVAHPLQRDQRNTDIAAQLS